MNQAFLDKLRAQMSAPPQGAGLSPPQPSRPQSAGISPTMAAMPPRPRAQPAPPSPLGPPRRLPMGPSPRSGAGLGGPGMAPTRGVPVMLDGPRAAPRLPSVGGVRLTDPELIRLVGESLAGRNSFPIDAGAKERLRGMPAGAVEALLGAAGSAAGRVGAAVDPYVDDARELAGDAAKRADPFLDHAKRAGASVVEDVKDWWNGPDEGDGMPEDATRGLLDRLLGGR